MRTGQLKQTISDAVDSRIRYVELSKRHAFVCTDVSLSVFERTEGGTGTKGQGMVMDEGRAKRVLRLQDLGGMGPFYRILLPEMPRMADGCTYGVRNGSAGGGEGSETQNAINWKMAIVPQKLDGIYATNVITQQDGYYAGLYSFFFSLLPLGRLRFNIELLNVTRS